MAQSKQLKRLEPWHHDLADFLLVHPQASLAECAARFDKSEVFISIVKHSDVFRAVYEPRRESISDAVEAGVVARASNLALKAFEIMAERLERNRETMPLREVRDTAELALKTLGYLQRGAAEAPVTVNIAQVDARVLAAARERMRQFNRVQGSEQDPVPALSAHNRKIR